MRTECFVSCLQSFAYICYFGPTYSTSASKRCYNSTAWGVQPAGIIVLQISLTGNGKQIRSCRRKTVCSEKQSAPILPSPHTPTNVMAYALLVRWVRRKTRRIRHMMDASIFYRPLDTAWAISICWPTSRSRDFFMVSSLSCFDLCSKTIFFLI